MADEYTYAFTTDSIRADLHHLWNLSGAPGKRAAIDAEFDRWLAARDREVAAKALREAAGGIVRGAGLLPPLKTFEHPAVRWLMESADRIEKGSR